MFQQNEGKERLLSGQWEGTFNFRQKFSSVKQIASPLAVERLDEPSGLPGEEATGNAGRRPT